MVLGDADAAALDQGANLALVGDELIQFRHAEPVGAGRWRLSGLWRGRRGTATGAMTAGTRFVLLDGYSASTVPVDVVPGAQVRVLASGVGDAAGVESGCRITGASLVPPSPVRLLGTMADGAVTLSWRRRSRTDWRWRDGIDAALGEEREAYRVTIAGGEHRAVLEVGAPRATIPLAPFGDAPLHVSVQQIGSRGLSPPAACTINGRFG